MTRERWLDLISDIKDKYPNLNQGTETFEGEPGQVEFIEFDGPTGRMRLELITRPVITGKRALGGRRTGSGSKVAYEYSDTEQSVSFQALRKQGDDWTELDASMFS